MKLYMSSCPLNIEKEHVWALAQLPPSGNVPSFYSDVATGENVFFAGMGHTDF
jgi:hypothetical protein